MLKALSTALIALMLSGTAEANCFRGINLSGAEFNDRGGTYGQQYIYPSEKIISYMAGKGLNAVRLPFMWERLQPKLNGPLSKDELARLKNSIDMILKARMQVILDPHNYAKYDDKQIGSAAVPNAAFADFWERLAKEFSNHKNVSFGLMNEPYDVSAKQWLESANAAIAAIRKSGAKNLILVPGTRWTGAHSWESVNADIMLNVKDPGHHFAYEVHQYLDNDFSGTHATCTRADDAVVAIKSMTKWLKDNGQYGFLGEFGAGGSAQCLTGLAEMVDEINKNKDVWTGWTYWVAGDWWGPDEPLNITPTPDGDRAQLKALERPGLLDTTCGGF